MKYSELSEGFNKAWGLDEKKIETMEKEFMEKIRSLLWHISADKGEEISITDSMESSYDGATILRVVEELINKFNDIYHIVSTTSEWIEDKNNSEVKNYHEE